MSLVIAEDCVYGASTVKKYYPFLTLVSSGNTGFSLSVVFWQKPWKVIYSFLDENPRSKTILIVTEIARILKPLKTWHPF